jgi:Replication-relaxation
MDEITVEPSRRRSRFSRDPAAFSFQVTERDVEIIRLVASHRFLRSTHISDLLVAPHKKICERLTLLYHAAYLDRPRAQLEYYLPGGGSSHLVYALGNRGARLLATRDGFRIDNLDWARKNKDSGRQFLLHTLAVADVRVALAVACRTHPGICLQDREQLLASLPEPTRKERFPWTMRVRIQHSGACLDLGITPDHAFALFLPDGRRRPFLVECDRGSMPIERAMLSQTSMLRKFLAYETAHSLRIHERQFGWKNFRVLTITSSAERARNMCALIAGNTSLKNSPLFLFAERAALAKQDILASAWRDSSGKLHSLV